MKYNNLHTLLRLRKQALDIATQQLSECLQAEMVATHAVRAQAGEIDHQRRAVEAAGSDDSDVETFGNWFTTARVRLGALSVDYDRAAVQTARARAELMAARTALELLEVLLRDRMLATSTEGAHDEQRRSDDWASRHGDTLNKV